MKTKSNILNARLTSQLLAYATAAGAVAASASLANAKVVYTPIHKYVYLDYTLDLNGDGIPDFVIQTSYLSGFNQLLVIPEIAFNKIAAVGKGCVMHKIGAAPFREGVVIGPEVFMRGKTACMASLFSWYSDGPWVKQKGRYLGVEFVINGQNHYGWARFNVSELCSAMITGYAYETIPNKSIIAGDEGNQADAKPDSTTLGALAAGVRALNLSPKEDKK